MNEDIRAKFKATLRGEWVGGVTYSFFDAVLYDGNVYFALRRNNSARPDISHDDWILSIGEGPQGQQGLQGEQGVQGDKPQHVWDGTSIAFENADGSMGAFVNIQGVRGDAGPQGLKGEKGDKGDTGPQGQQGIKGEKGDTASICVPPLIVAPIAALPNSSIAVTITLSQNHYYTLPLEGFYLSIVGDGDPSNNTEPFYIPSPGGHPYDYTFSPHGEKDDVVRIRAAIVDILGNVSNFSEAEILLTAPIVFPPRILSPSHYSINLAHSFHMQISDIENVAGITPMGVGTHVQVATDAAFTDIVFDTTSSIAYETSIFVRGLSSYTQYYARARHRDAVYGWSAWSDTVTFKTVYEDYVKANGTWIAPESGTIEILLVGGGGGGGGSSRDGLGRLSFLDGGQGGNNGGLGGANGDYADLGGPGGGAGGLIKFTTEVVKQGAYACVIGSGGGFGENGGDTSFNGISTGAQQMHWGGNGGSPNRNTSYGTTPIDAGGGDGGRGSGQGGTNGWHFFEGYKVTMVAGGGAGGWIGDGQSPGGQGGEAELGNGFAESGRSDGYGGRGTQPESKNFSETRTGGKPGSGFGGGGGSGSFFPKVELNPEDSIDYAASAGGGGAGYGAGGGGNARKALATANITVQGGRGADGVIFIRYFPE